MSRLFFYCMLALVVGAALAIFLQEDPGYVLISFRGWTFEATLGSVVLAIFALFILFVGLLWLLKLLNPLKLFRRRTWGSLLGKGDPVAASENGVQLLLLGRWQDAYKLLVENAERVPSPLFNYLAASLAAFERGDRLGWLFCLDRAEKLAGSNNFGIKSLRGLLELRSDEPQQALTILLALKRVAPPSPFVLRQIKDIYLRLPDWEGLAGLLPELEKHQVVNAQELQTLNEKLTQHRMAVAASESLASLRLVYHDMPKYLRNSEVIVMLYLKNLLQLDEDTEAVSVLSHFLKQQWSDNIIGMLGKTGGGNPQQMLLLLEGWLKERPNNAVLMLTLGRLSLRNQLWGKAREYFENALRVSKSGQLTAEISAELGRLLDHLGENERSLECYQRAMNLMEQKLPDLPLPVLNR